MFQVRLRVRLGKPLDTQETELRIQVEGRDVDILSGQEKGQPLSAAEWLLIRARSFKTATCAEAFGLKLKGVVQAAGVCCFIGIDIGNDNTTGFINAAWAREIGFIAQDETTHPTVHGLLVIEDDPKIRFPMFQAQATVKSNCDNFVSALTELGNDFKFVGVQTSNALRLLNEAMINSEPLAQMVLSISAIEALGQKEKWSTEQLALLRRLQREALDDAATSEAERIEVAESVGRIFRVGLRQGVKRVLARLDLPQLLKEWDEIYGIRSSVFHGTKVLDKSEAAQVAARSITLCGNIILKLAESEGLALPAIAYVHIPALRVTENAPDSHSEMR